MKLIVIFLLGALAAHAQLALTVSPVKATEQKAIAPLALINSFAGKTELAHAAVFSLNSKPTMIGQPTNWVIVGNTNRPSPAVGATNAFSSVLIAIKPITTTNANTKAMFNRVILEADKLACTGKAAQVQPASPSGGK